MVVVDSLAVIPVVVDGVVVVVVDNLAVIPVVVDGAVVVVVDSLAVIPGVDVVVVDSFAGMTGTGSSSSTHALPHCVHCPAGVSQPGISQSFEAGWVPGPQSVIW